MDTVKHKHTNIIDDLDAIALAQQGGKRKALPDKKKNNARGAVPACPAAADSSKSKSARKPNSSQGTSRYYEKDGVNIPLYEKSGRKKPHARLSNSLRNKTIDFLLNVVEEYAGVEKRKEFQNSGKSKTKIAEWIEKHETYALGPNPKSTLNVAMPIVTEECDLNIEEEEAFWADPEPALDHSTGKIKGVAVVQSPVRKEVQEKNKGQAHVRSPGVGQGTKRQGDSISDLTQAAGHKTKISKTFHAEPLAKQLHVRNIKGKVRFKDELQKSVVEKKMLEFNETVEMSKLAGTTTARSEEGMGEAKANLKAVKPYKERLKSMIQYVGMHLDNADTSSMVVHLPDKSEDRVLTLVMNSSTMEPTLYDTAIPHIRGRVEPASAHRVEKPFLKEGKHGHGGDFKNDPDRYTGRGHQITPEDQVGLEKYLSFRGRVFKKYPRYPSVAAGQETDLTIKKAWSEFDKWHNNFTYKYAGSAVNHLWPCGCEKIGDESEDEEE